MFKKLLQLIGLSAANEPVNSVEVTSITEPTPVVEEAPKPKSTRGRKPKATTEATPKKAPRKRKPKSE
jgi:hypothetical protein